MFGHLNCGFLLKRHQTGSIMLAPPLFQTLLVVGPKTIIRAVLSSEFCSLESAALDHRSLLAPSRPVPVRPRRRGLRSWGGPCFRRQRPSEASNSFGWDAGRSVTPRTVSTDPPVQQILLLEPGKWNIIRTQCEEKWSMETTTCSVS